jgi:transcriptional regulator with XRE-family HTH domain
VANPTLSTKQAVRVFLASHGKTQTWLASRAKVSESTLSKVLSGRMAPSEDLRNRLLKITGVDIATREQVA